MLKIGEEIENRYIVGRSLGSGPSSRTFEVWDRLEQGPRVLKFQPPGPLVDFQQAFTRFNSLSHPNFPRFKAIGQFQSRTFVIEELLDAVPFDSIAWNTDQPSLLFDALYQGLVALEFLHRQGLIHGNLKPQNILCAAPRPFTASTPVERYRELEAQGAVRVYLVAPHLLERSQIQMAGTPHYMAPEVFLNEANPRSDLYSLAVVLFESLCGQFPFPDVRELMRSPETLPPFPYSPVTEPFGRFLRRLGHTRQDERLSSAAEALGLLEQGLYPPNNQFRAHSFRLIDRDPQMNRFSKALADLQLGRGSVLLLEGVQGIGKTRLLDQFRSVAQSSQIRTETRIVEEEAGSPVQLLGNPSALPSLAGKTGLPLATLLVRRLVAEIQQPLLLFCPNLHRAGPSITGILDLLSRSLENVPLLFVGTSCEPMTLDPACRIELKGLHGNAMTQFITDVTGAAMPAPSFVEKLEILTGGNPFFVQLALDLLVRSEAIRRKLGRWNFEFDRLPTSAFFAVATAESSGLILRFLDGLQPEEIRTLAALHLLQGNLLQTSDLHFLLGGPATFPVWCNPLLLQAWGRQVSSGCAILAQAAYNRLPQMQRTQLHLRAFEWLSRQETRPALMAAHAIRSESPKRAIPFLLEASDQAYQEGTVEACVYHLERAVALLDPGPERANVLERLADRMLELGHADQAEHCLREAMSHPSPARALKLARAMLACGETDNARVLLETLRYEKNLDEIDRLHLLGQALLQLERQDEATRAFSLAEELARRLGGLARVHLARLLLDMGNDLLDRNQPEAAQERFQECLTIFSAEGMSKMQAVCLNALGLCSFHLKRWDTARAALSTSIQLHEDLGSLDKAMISRTNLGRLCSQLGRWDEAERHYRSSLQVAKRIAASPRYQIRSLGGLAQILMRRDDTDEALSLLETANQLATGSNLLPEEALVLGWMGELHLLERRDHDAERCLRHGISIAADLDASDIRAENLRHLAELRFEQGWSSDALACCREAQAIFAESENQLELAQCKRLLGRISVQQGSAMAAIGLLESAIDTLRRLEARFELGLALLSGGLAYSKAGLEPRAIEALEESIAIFRDLGARRELHHAEALLRTLGATHELIEVRHLKLLLGVISRLNQSLDLKQVLGQILDCVLELTGARRGLLILDNDQGQIELQIGRSNRHEILDPETMDISQSIVQRVRAQRRSIVVTDINDNALLRQRESIVRLGLRSVMCVPLVVDSRMLGLIYVDDQSTSDNFYTRTDLGLLEAFAVQAALAIDKAKLHAQMKESYAELQTSKANLEGAYKRLQSIQLSLSQAEKMSVLGHLASGIAHELNQPLTYMTNWVEVNLAKAEVRRKTFPLADSTQEKDLKQLLGIIEQMTDIVKGIHRYSKKTSPAASRIQLREPLEDALRILEHQLQIDGVHTIKRLEDKLEVHANRNQLTQVFINLLVNARDAMLGQPERRLTIESYRNLDCVFVRISDTGCGIAPAHMEHLFEPFFTTKSEQRGTGLGLSVVKDIVEQYGGKLELHSQLGVGTNAILQLPSHR